MKFSLILPTVGRVAEIQRFLESLAAQDEQDFELIVIDQNPDDRLVAMLRDFSTRFQVNHIRLQKRGLSGARNRGLAAARGDILGFPDDDCTYAPGLLRAATEVLAHGRTAAGQPWDGVVGRVLDLDADQPAFLYCGQGSPGQLDVQAAYRLGVVHALFLRVDAVAGRRFDETLGLGAGTRWGAGDDSDYLMRSVAAGNRILHAPQLIVRHPNPHAARGFRDLISREYRYGRSNGLVTARHFGSTALRFEALPNLWWVLVNLIIGRFKSAAYLAVYTFGFTLGHIDYLRSSETAGIA